MKQPVPTVTDKDVERIALRDFGKENLAEAMGILKKYGQHKETRLGTPRVRLAILKLANGDLDLLSKYTENANQDFRDIISLAEYPKYLAEVGFERNSQKTKTAVIEADWNQYQ